jgi:hypothetical protein
VRFDSEDSSAARPEKGHIRRVSARRGSFVSIGRGGLRTNYRLLDPGNPVFEAPDLGLNEVFEIRVLGILMSNEIVDSSREMAVRVIALSLIVPDEVVDSFIQMSNAAIVVNDSK